MKKINEVELRKIFNGVRSNEKSAFETLYKDYNNLVYSIAFSILKNKENSEDIVQIVFSKIYTLDKDKLPLHSEASWIYTLTKNETLNFLRSKKEEISLEDIYYIGVEDTELSDIMDKDRYNRIIASLTMQEQEIISLKILSNLSFKEISKLLEIPIGTVQWKYYKSLHTLKILLSNLAMFIIAITLFVAKKLNIERKGTNLADQDQNYRQSIENQDSEQSKIKGEHPADESDSKLSLDKDTTENNPIENNTLAEENNTSLSNTDIGLIGVSSLFLVITVIFLLIFIKHQQKAKKKVSK